MELNTDPAPPPPPRSMRFHFHVFVCHIFAETKIIFPKLNVLVLTLTSISAWITVTRGFPDCRVTHFAGFLREFIIIQGLQKRIDWILS